MELHEMFTKLGAGKMARIEYETELPVKASFKKLGIKIIKHTVTTVRCGVEYSNIKSVITKRNADTYIAGSRNYSNHYEWVIKNVLKYNTNTQKYYLSCATLTNGGANTKSKYTIVTADGTILENQLDFDHNFVIDSYFKCEEKPVILSINIDNIISINGVKIKNG